MEKSFEELSKEELQKKLQELNELLEDTEELRSMQLGQTGHHIPGTLVKKYADEITGIKENIEKVKNLLYKIDGK